LLFFVFADDENDRKLLRESQNFGKFSASPEERIQSSAAICEPVKTRRNGDVSVVSAISIDQRFLAGEANGSQEFPYCQRNNQV
jgi:hypothetical protein